MVSSGGAKKHKEATVRRSALMARRLWRQAERDIRVARMLLQPESYYGAAAFAQWAAEKSLKAAYWHVRVEEPTWNHNLMQCAEQVAERSGGLPTALNDAIAQLAPVFERSRYPLGNERDPIPAELIEEEEARLSISFG